MAAPTRSEQPGYGNVTSTLSEPSLDNLVGARDAAQWIQLVAEMWINTTNPRGRTMQDGSANVKFRTAVYLACLPVSARGELTGGSKSFLQLGDQMSWLWGSRGHNWQLYLPSLSDMMRGNDSPPLLTHINRLAANNIYIASITTATEAHTLIQHNITWMNFGLKLTSTYKRKERPRMEVWQAWWQHIASVLESLIQVYKQQTSLVSEEGKETDEVGRRVSPQGDSKRQKISTSTRGHRVSSSSSTSSSQATRENNERRQEERDSQCLVAWARKVQAEVRANAILDPIAVKKRLVAATESMIHNEAMRQANVE
jgi:hypothetical protein